MHRGKGKSIIRFCLLPCFFLIASCAGRYGVSTDVLSSGPQNRTAGISAGQQTAPATGERRTIVASWYGPEFNGKPTSSGESFDMYAFTCAHREYPFGTRLHVVNLKNNKDVECVVNDRGPFVAGRDLDLSYACAKKIDLIGTGTATVLIEPVGRDMRYVKYVRYGTPGSIATIQLGSFTDEANAKRLKTALELRHTDVYILQASVNGATYYRVRIGKFTARAEAASVGKALADEGYNVLITRYERQI